jgi:hypothetical protein
MKNLTEDEFDNQYTVVLDARGDTVRPSVDGVEPDSKHLWTIVEAESSLYAISGWHFVNRIGYILAEEAWDEETEAVWYEASDDEDDVDEVAA